ncbi:hypothetical protein L2Y94_13610 [Luteibacter aegosomatis]|uniref:hypothetical protein n=1 Tax=Luteibacter aegosomatis TaxID=2911537 RepID=UPI001FF911DF|nr:hypothetical protein [Luteibacter aegosomatis]UPG84377.1 hypothetical protein L2Y94_13610 [Luteibacter aegosomatis]
MNNRTFLQAAGAVLLMAAACDPALARKSDEPAPDTLCTILGTADRYVDTTVTVRGIASASGKATVLSDADCQGRIVLSIDQSDSHRREISSLRRALSTNGSQANATVFGRFHSTGDAQVPYAIDVYSARDVAEVN